MKDLTSHYGLAFYTISAENLARKKELFRHSGVEVKSKIRIDTTICHSQGEAFSYLAHSSTDQVINELVFENKEISIHLQTCSQLAQERDPRVA